MNECRPVDDDHDGFFEEPATVLAVCRESPAMCKETGRERLLKYLSQFLQFLAVGSAQPREFLEPVLAFRRIFLSCEGGVLGFGHITQIANEIHRLMVADQDVNPPASRRRLGLDAHEQIHRLARLRTTVEYVAHDDQVCGTSGPGQLRIENARVP